MDYSTLINAWQTDRYRSVYGVVRNYHQLADGDVSFQVGREWFQFSDRFPTAGYNYAEWHEELIHEGNYVGIAYVARDYQDPLSFFVRHYSGNTIVRWADAENMFGPAFNEPVLGPGRAKGAVIWNDGSGAPSRTVEITEHEPAALASSFRAAGWDVFRLDRTIDDLAAARAAELISDAARHLRRQGYAKVVLMGQSAGAWLSLLAAGSEDVHAVIANAPAFHGNGKYKSLNATALYDVLEHLGHGRLMLSFFREDEWDPGGRAARAESILTSARVEHLVVAEPKEFAGHFAGYSGLFARRFADCALAIAGDGAAPTVDACEDKGWGREPSKNLVLPPELLRRLGTPIDRYLGRWYGYFNNGREFMFTLVAAQDDEVKAAYIVGPSVGHFWKPRPILRQGTLQQAGFLLFDDKSGPVLNIAAQADGTLQAKWMRKDGTTSTSAILHRLAGAKAAQAGHLDVRATN